MNLQSARARLLTRWWLASLVLASSLYSQPLLPRFDRITVADGLSQDIVTSIVQDSRGFLWFGTEDGLNRYDGYSIRVFKHRLRDTTSISDNVIHALFVDRNHRLWVGTGNGLNRFDDARESFVHFNYNAADSGSLSNDAITAIQEDAKGTLWIGTISGLNRFEEASGTFARFFRNLRDPESLSSSNINGILLDRSGSLWIATTNGFCRYQPDNGSFKRYLFASGSRPLNVRRMYEDRTGSLWISVEQQGLWRLSPSRSTPTRFPAGTASSRGRASKSPADVMISSLEEDGRGNVWIGHFSGLDIFDPGTGMFWHFFANPTVPTAPGGRVETVFRDNAGTMWLGTYQGGVYRYDPRRQQFSLLRPPGPDGEGVTAVYEDRSGTVWIGTEGGLDRYDPKAGTFIQYRHDDRDARSLSSTQVNAILRDRNGNLWIGGSGPARFNLDRFDAGRQSFLHFPVKGVRTLHEDGDGTIWVGLLDEEQTGTNLLRLDAAGSIRGRYQAPGSGVWSIFEDHNGNLWLGGQYCCFAVLDRKSGTIIPFETRPADSTKLSSGAVRTMAEDSRFNLWLGTWGGGLLQFNPTTTLFRRFTEEDGLPSNYVKGILPDNHGRFWVATESGLSRLDPETGLFRNFTVEDGLQGDRFLSGSCFKGRSGLMYFGGTNGLNMFHPESISDNPNIPPIVITKFKIFDREVPPPRAISDTGEIRLSHDQDFFSFEFVSLDYTSPQRNRYAYILEGFDPDWVQAGTRRYASYTGVRPGVYTFRVRGSNNDGIWNSAGAEIRIIVDPPVWQTWWFRLLAISAVVALLFLAYRYRVSHLLAVERLRAHIASDLHDDIGTNLSTIALASQSLGRLRGIGREGLELVDRIRTVAERTTDQMKDIVWVLKTSNDSLDHVVARMGDVARQLLTGIRLRFEAPAESLLEKVSLEFKRSIFLFYKECLNNIVKHSRATRVIIRVEQSEDAFVLHIEDNGKGFVSQKRSSGSGLENLKARAKQLGGSLDITSKPGRGTRIVLTVKMTQMRHSIHRREMLS